MCSQRIQRRGRIGRRQLRGGIRQRCGECAGGRRGASRCPSSPRARPRPSAGTDRRATGSARPSRGCHAGSSLARRAPVPRTHVLADVAAVDLRANRRPQRLVHRAARLDREIRQAARRVDDVGLDDGARSDTRRDSACTCRTDRRRRVRLELGVRENLAQEQPRAERRVDQARVLADPAEARPARRTRAPARARCPRTKTPRTRARRRRPSTAAARAAARAARRGSRRPTRSARSTARPGSADAPSSTAGPCCRRTASEMTDRAVGSTRAGSSRSSSDSAR